MEKGFVKPELNLLRDRLHRYAAQLYGISYDRTKNYSDKEIIEMLTQLKRLGDLHLNSITGGYKYFVAVKDIDNSIDIFGDITQNDWKAIFAVYPDLEPAPSFV